MPNIKSAKKRMRIEEKRRLRNNTVKSAVRTQLTKARSAIVAAPEAETTEAALREAISNLDHAASKGVIHKNNAARRKSRLMKRLNLAASAPAEAPEAKAAGKGARGSRAKAAATAEAAAPEAKPARGRRGSKSSEKA